MAMTRIATATVQTLTQRSDTLSRSSDVRHTKSMSKKLGAQEQQRARNDDLQPGFKVPLLGLASHLLMRD